MGLKQEFDHIKQNLAIGRRVVFTVDINHADTTTLNFNYYYLKDAYTEEKVALADSHQTFKAIERMMNRYMANCCGRLFSTGYSKSVDFTIREFKDDEIHLLYNVIKSNINDNEARSEFKKVEAELNHLLEADKKNTPKPRA